jgi:lysyl-tRNA synthetase class 2
MTNTLSSGPVDPADAPTEPPTEAELERLVDLQRAKVDDLRRAGVNPYDNQVPPLDPVAVVRERIASLAAQAPPPAEPAAGVRPLASDRFRVAGRITAVRSHGGSTFVKVRDRTGEIQVYVRKDQVGPESYALFRKLERGDFMLAEGGAFVTKTGELSVLATTVRLLTKAVRALPEKWHGLTDVETRYRQRYVDLIVNPEATDVFRRRSCIMRRLRSFLEERDFLEVETPMMHSVLGGAAARPFCTHHNALHLDLYLRIAPELFLKRLVVGGFERVFELGRNFRNEGLSRQHNPEFTMLELYQAYATYADLLVLTEELFLAAAEACGVGPHLTYQSQPVDLTRPWPRWTVRQAVAAALEASPSDFEDERALARFIDARALSSRNDELGTALRKAETYGERLTALFDHAGERALPTGRPVFVLEYPADTSPLARRNDRDPRFVDRFELFIVGREHANAFSELNDPTDQRARFQRQLEKKRSGDAEAMEYDEDYCRALEHGMPPTAGLGVGIDRLVMLLCDQASIRDVILFPLMRPDA